MAIRYGVRWRPVPFRSTIETITVASETGPGWRVQTLQAVAYDDTQLGTTANPYRPGDPASEQYLAIIAEIAIQLDIAAFAGKTIAQSRAMWDAARDTQKDAWLADPNIGAMLNAAVGGMLSPFVVLE